MKSNPLHARMNAILSSTCFSAVWEMYLSLPISAFPAHLASANKSVPDTKSKKPNNAYLQPIYSQCSEMMGRMTYSVGYYQSHQIIRK